MALMGNTTLFRIDAILSAPKIVLQPQSNDIFWLIMECIRDCVDSTKVGSSLIFMHFFILLIFVIL